MSDEAVPMDVDVDDVTNQHFGVSNSQQHPTSIETPAASGTTSPQDKDEAVIVLSLKWTVHDAPQKMMKQKTSLQKMLQSWFNKRKYQADCSVKEILADGRVVITIKPAPAPTMLQKLNNQTLSRKDENEVTITSVSLARPPPELDTQVPEDASMNLPPSLPKPQTEQIQPGEQSSSGSAAGEEIPFCYLSAFHFWYVNHMYREEMKSIEKECGVQIIPEVKVRFEAGRRDGNPQKALDEFTNLVQKCIPESCVSVIPLKFIDPDQWNDALKIIQKKENKLLVTLSSEKISVCGPSYSQDVISRSLYADTQQKTYTNASVEEYEREFPDTSLKIDMTIKDPLIDNGLTMEESYWELMITSYYKQVTKISEKFNVDLKESGISQGKVNVKAFYRRDKGNVSMESHALRALFHLYQKIATSPKSLSQSQGATGLTGSAMKTSSFFLSAGASNEAVLNGQSANRLHDADTPEGGGATAGDKKDENCCICMEPFKNKTQLKCKHEFCEECLQQAKDANGPICPICRVVFGKIMGDQPQGRMSCNTVATSLPGFPHCGTIVITYNFPGGRQTEKHPNPGQLYHGTSRQAYLPDNKEGNKVLQLLKRAFEQRLIFTVGTSRTTGFDGQVTWNDIHHKTSITGGPESFGYPDPMYLSRVREELKAKGIE